MKCDEEFKYITLWVKFSRCGVENANFYSNNSFLSKLFNLYCAATISAFSPTLALNQRQRFREGGVKARNTLPQKFQGV